MDASVSGILLALANMIVIAIGLELAVPTRDMAGAIVVFGFVPTLFLIPLATAVR